MTRSILAIAALTAGLCAQGPALVYDNGPFETSPGFSNLDTATGHTVPGYGGQAPPIDNRLVDEFVVASAMVIEEVEFFCYQTGTSPGVSTITGAKIAFYDSDPSLYPAIPLAPMAGSPAPTFDMFSTPNNPLGNAWTGVFREVDGDHATNRPIMAVRLTLEDAAGTATPLVLTPGTYWLRVQAAGSAPSGPWFPPITYPGQRATGNAMQFVSALPQPLQWVNPITSGTAGAQGLPFRLYGQSATPGTIALWTVGCGGTGITVGGAPNLGGFIHTRLTLTSTGTIPVIGFGFNPAPQQFCGCQFIHSFPVTVWLRTESTLPLPLDPSFAGLRLSIQAVEFGATGGCPQVGGFTVTDAYRIDVSF